MAKTAKVSPGRGNGRGAHKGSVSKQENETRVTRVVAEEGDVRVIVEIAGNHRLTTTERHDIQEAAHQAIWDGMQETLLPFMSVCFKLDPVRFGK